MTFHEVKVCVLGDSGVGKSSLVQRFVHNTFNIANESTIGASFMTKTLVINNATIKFNIWDTAGQEKYRALAPMYFRGAAACIVVYDVTSLSSYRSVHSWVKELQSHAPSDIVLVLAANKCDLDRRAIPVKDAKAYASNIGALFMETSAKNSFNVNQLYLSIASRLQLDSKPSSPNQYISLENELPKYQSKKSCC
ncbi:Ras-related protein Rab-22A [Halotydeus destructor]|nr:Ras-related protein Rab-22A [Halotydeus destructor]